MRFRRSLDDLFGAPRRVRLARLLCRHPGKEFTGREAARLAHLSHPQASRALAELELAGLVERRSAGAAMLWKFIPEHYLAEPLRALFRAEQRAPAALVDTLRDGLEGAPIASALLFGSIARGEERPNSDVDLYIEMAGPARKAALEEVLTELSPRVHRTFGNALSPLIYSSRESRNPPSPRLLRTIRTEGVPVLP
jgi:predicted nucleotidyltransferase